MAAGRGRPACLVQGHRHAGVGTQVARRVRRPFAAVHNVRARTALQPVVTTAATQRVRAAMPEQHVVLRVARQDVIVRRRSHEVLDPAQPVPRRMAAGCPARSQVHHHPGVGTPVARRVARPFAAVHNVRARAARQPVVAAAATQRVRATHPTQIVVLRVARQNVIVRRALEVLDPAQRVAFRMAARRGRPARLVQRHPHPRGGTPIARHVRPGAAVQGVAARPADEPVVVRFAVQTVRVRAAHQIVVAAAATQRVRPAQTMQTVLAGSAGEHVVAARSIQCRHGCSSLESPLRRRRAQRQRPQANASACATRGFLIRAGLRDETRRDETRRDETRRDETERERERRAPVIGRAGYAHPGHDVKGKSFGAGTGGSVGRSTAPGTGRPPPLRPDQFPRKKSLAVRSWVPSSCTTRSAAPLPVTSTNTSVQAVPVRCA